jgi:hypothetical protein
MQISNGHSAADKESPSFLTFYLFTVWAIHELPLLTFSPFLKEEILHLVQDDKERSNDVILSVSEESPVF